MAQELTFESWCEALDKVASDAGYSAASYTQETGPECWRDYYDAGDSPYSAFMEDCSYGDPEDSEEDD